MTTAILAAHRRGSRFDVRRPGGGRAPMAGRGNRGLVLLGCGLALLPWLVVLWRNVPDQGPVPHWNLAWVGLDGLEALGLISAGVLHLREDPRAALPLSGTAGILLIDAWLDVSTAASSTERHAAIAMLAVEVPLAALCLHTAYGGLAQHRQGAMPGNGLRRWLASQLAASIPGAAAICAGLSGTAAARGSATSADPVAHEDHRRDAVHVPLEVGPA